MKANHPEKEREEMVYGKNDVSRNHYCVWQTEGNEIRFRAMASNLETNLAISPQGFGRRRKEKDFVSIVHLKNYDLGPHTV